MCEDAFACWIEEDLLCHKDAKTHMTGVGKESAGTTTGCSITSQEALVSGKYTVRWRFEVGVMEIYFSS